MDPYSPGEKLNIKTRKPYTITKQRERWTEDEHNSFLEALKLYGRAWQRIEEHIGTKTAVQIRSHAQKFFTKLEKEAVAKGVPIRQALDMEIPPPRPKRKPNYPYPRKTHPEVAEKDGKQLTLHSGKCILDLETKPLAEITGGDEKLENEQVENGTEEAPCVSLSSENENSISRPSCTFREFIPAMEEVINRGETNQSYITVETRKHHKSDQDGIMHTNITSNTLFVGNSHLFQENIVEGEICDKPNDILQQGVQNYPRHVPVQIVDGNQGIPPPPEISCQESTLVNIAAAASRCSSYQTVPTFHPLLTHPTISSLIVSSLLQNPAAHAAASFAATFWQPANTEASRDETPSMAAIAAATVAAATAWWAAHGLLPFYSSCTSPFSGTPIHGNEEDKKQSEGLPKEHPPSKSAAVSYSSEDSDEGGGDGKLNTAAVEETKEMTPAAETNVGKQVDRSSCGSNTTSSSEIETDALEKHGKEKEDSKESDDVHLVLPCNDSISRRSRSCITTNESWKEVSEEGRLAFQALFSRQVLPQSFSHRQNNNNNNSVVTEKDQRLDLNRVTCSSQGQGEEGLLTMGLGNVKLNVHHTGFKPYKRCSIESKTTSTATQNDDKGPKRMRLDST